MTFCKQKHIIKAGDIMINFMKHDFDIGKIELAMLVKAGTGSTMHKNRKSCGLAFFCGGERTFYFDKKKIKVEKNTVVYFPKGSNYNIKEKCASDCYAINFQMTDEAVFEPFAIKVKNINSFLESFKNSSKIWEKKKVGYSAKIKSNLYNIIYNLQSESQLVYKNLTVIQPAVDYIHSNYYKKNISVAYLASLCNISTVYLNNIFVNAFAMPPIKYINTLKMTRAAELLTSQMYTVSEVCFMSGFNDESHFSRAFKKQFGVAPRIYKKVISD